MTPSESHNSNQRPKLKIKAATSVSLKTGSHKSMKSAQAYKQTYSSGPPLIPAYIFDRLMEYTTKIKMAKRSNFISLVCRYWSLKRESRRGAPLLKRLHLEVSPYNHGFIVMSDTGIILNSLGLPLLVLVIIRTTNVSRSWNLSSCCEEI